MSKIYEAEGDDPEMLEAYEQARETFRYFWREVSWERRRIVPALDLASVKAPFSDGKEAKRVKGQPDVEHMWMSDVDFDGESVSGTLLNSPNWIRRYKEGDSVRKRLDRISDWMYAIEGQVYGAFTVNLLRSRMGRRERQEHDEAWGLDFGDPNSVRLVPDEYRGKEHPMSVAMAEKAAEQLRSDPSLLTGTDDHGRTLLHQETLAGSRATIEVLLDQGAEIDAKTENGLTALDLAKSVGWKKVVELLTSRGAH